MAYLVTSQRRTTDDPPSPLLEKEKKRERGRMKEKRRELPEACSGLICRLVPSHTPAVRERILSTEYQTLFLVLPSLLSHNPFVFSVSLSPSFYLLFHTLAHPLFDISIDYTKDVTIGKRMTKSVKCKLRFQASNEYFSNKQNCQYFLTLEKL